MRVIVLLKAAATFKNLLPYLNEFAEFIFAYEQNIAEVSASNLDYILTYGHFIVKKLTNFGIDPA